MLGLTCPYIISIAKSASKCYLELLEKLLIRICRTVGPSLAASLEPLAHRRISRCCKDVYVNSFFPHTARLWNSLPIECSLLTYDLNCFKSRVNRQLLILGSFYRDFLYHVIFLWFFFL